MNTQTTANNTATQPAQISPEVDALYSKLDAIFGIPKELTTEEQTKADAIMAQLDALYEAEDESGELSPENAAKAAGLSSQLDALYGVKAWDALTSEEQAQVDAIFSQLDSLEGIDDKADPQEDALYAQLDAIFGTPKELSADEQKQADALESQIDTLFEAMGEGEPTAEQETQIDALFNQMDALYGIKSWDALSSEEQTQVDNIFSQLEQLEGGDNEDWDDSEEGGESWASENGSVNIDNDSIQFGQLNGNDADAAAWGNLADDMGEAGDWAQAWSDNIDTQADGSNDISLSGLSDSMTDMDSFWF